MKIKQCKTKVFDQEYILELMYFNKADGKKWKQIFDQWKKLKIGLQKYNSRGPNFPEGLSEVAFCLWSGSGRYIKIKGVKKGIAGSFDTFNLDKARAEQIKACSIDEDLTSFGPKSKWDDLYFLDFYRDGKVDGTFDVYLIPNKLIDSQNLNKVEKFIDQQVQKRRPRFSLKKELIPKYKIKPLAKGVKVW